MKTYAEGNKVQEFYEHLTYRLESCQAKIAKHIEKIKKDAYYALEWSEDFFKNSAEERILKEILSMQKELTTPMTLKGMADRYKEQALRDAKWFSKSTSPASNLAKQYLTSVMVEMAETIEQFFAEDK